MDSFSSSLYFIWTSLRITLSTWKLESIFAPIGAIKTFESRGRLVGINPLKDLKPWSLLSSFPKSTHSLFRYCLTIYLEPANEPYLLQCRSISGEEISFLILSGKYIAIALVDQYKLRYGIHVISSFYFFLLKCDSP